MIDSSPCFAEPAAWAALATLIVMEVVLGIDNLIFISILSNKLPEAQRGQGAAHRHQPGAGHAAACCCRRSPGSSA